MGEVTLPNEIWMKIFKSLDRRQWMKLRLVCHRFFMLIEDLLNKDQEWRYLMQELLYECITPTMQRAYPYNLIGHINDITDLVLWRGTYLSYKKWQKVLINPVTRSTIVPISAFGEITCVCTFDKYIAIAFVNGSKANYTLEDLSQPFYLAHQDSKINQIEFWYSNGELLVVTVDEKNILRFWDLHNKVEIATDGFFARNIAVGECRHFCIGEMDGILTSYERVNDHIRAGPTLDFAYRRRTENEPLPTVVNNFMDGRNMQAMAYIPGYTGSYVYHGIIEDTKLTQFKTDQIVDFISLPKNLDTSIERLVMSSITLYFCISETSIGSTNYYTDEWCEYNLFGHFGSHVRSIKLHAQILMLGLDDGSVHLLHIDHYGDVIELENKIKHARKIQVDDVPIVEITVLEVDKKPCIVVITEQRVHLLNFF